MSQSLVEIYIHLVWATYRREPLMTGTREALIHRCIAREAQKEGCVVIAVGGIEDHIHALVRLPARIDLPRLVNQMKGVSSHEIRSSPDGEGFGWQDGYAAISVSPNHRARVQSYIEGQREHHASGELHALWEVTCAPTDARGANATACETERP